MQFYNIDEVEDSLLKYAVIVAKYQNSWVFCKNKNRKWELPGGHREEGEAIVDTAKRELFEETGAVKYCITPICVYKINNYGLLCYADIEDLGNLPESEISEIGLFQDIPNDLSFPLYHPVHFSKVKESLGTV